MNTTQTKEYQEYLKTRYIIYMPRVLYPLFFGSNFLPKNCVGCKPLRIFGCVYAYRMTMAKKNYKWNNKN